MTEARRPISSHLEDYRAKLAAGGVTSKHVNRTVKCIECMCTIAKIDRAEQITADTVNRAALKLEDEGMSARTRQAYLTAIKSFTKWLASHGKLPRDPLVAVQKPNPKADRRMERRALLPDEWNRLQETTLADGMERYGMSAHERVLLCAVAIR